MCITLYSTGCPNCRMLESKLRSKNIEFTTITDEREIADIAHSHNIMSMPFIQVDNDTFLSFPKAIKWVNTYEGEQK